MLYILPTPPGHFLTDVVTCERVTCRFSNGHQTECDNQCNVRHHPQLEGRRASSVPTGAVNDSPWPPQCQAGSFAAGVGESDQSSPSCTGFCPEGKACFVAGLHVLSEDSLPPVEAGYFTRLGDAHATPCDIGTYSEGGAGACTPCPGRGRDETTRSQGSTSRSDCVCTHDLFDTGGECADCPNAATCDGLGSTTRNLNLRHNHWRLSTRTTDIHACSASDLSPCVGGTDVLAYCAAGLRGPLCHLSGSEW